jgi:alkaline phosphatase D
MSLRRRDFLRRSSALGLSTLALPLLACGDDGANAGVGTEGGTDTAGPDATGTNGVTTTGSGTGTTPGTGASVTSDDPSATTDASATGTDTDGLPGYEYDGPMGGPDTFTHGVASGDPLTDSVILWTKVTLGELEPQLGGTTIQVFVEVAEDPAFATRVAAAYFDLGPDTDYTFKVDTDGLAAGSTYYYRFWSLGVVSPIGRTRTAPEGAADSLRFGVTSCSNYAYGYFHAYRHLANRPDLDAVIHLGDYIYEYEDGGYGDVRPNDPPTEIVTLSDYRRRYASYRKDPDLQELHRQNPFICLWDDHEFTNDPERGGTGAENHTPGVEGDWQARIQVSLQAYGEWIPCRLARPSEIWRTLPYGELVQITTVDRHQPNLFPEAFTGDEYLGEPQMLWLEEQIMACTAQWFVLAQQTTFASVPVLGGWPAASRDRVLGTLAGATVQNLVVLTGDIHTFTALRVGNDEGVELCCGSITSPGGPRVPPNLLPGAQLIDGTQRGYLVIDFDRTRMAADFWAFPDAAKNDPALPPEALLAAFDSQDGANALTPRAEPLPPRPSAPAFAPS